MKAYFLIVFLTLTAGQLMTCQTPDGIEWNEDRKLSWSDFNVDTLNKVKVNGADLEAGAVSCVRLVFEYKYVGDSLSFVVRNFFIPNNSYVYTSKCSHQLLSHEQCHFDLSELYARKIRKRIRELQASGELDLDKYFMTYKNFRKELALTDKQYDKDTFYGGIKSEQERWNLKIKKELLELVYFAKKLVSENLKSRFNRGFYFIKLQYFS